MSTVCHSCAGAAIRGGVPAHVNGMGLLLVELYPDHTGSTMEGTEGRLDQQTFWEPAGYSSKAVPDSGSSLTK